MYLQGEVPFNTNQKKVERGVLKSQVLFSVFTSYRGDRVKSVKKIVERIKTEKGHKHFGRKDKNTQ